MPSESPCYFDLRCPACSWQEVCGPKEMTVWLRKAGKVRPGREPEPEILAEVFRAAAPRLRCPRCGATGLAATPSADDSAAWPGMRRCAGCSKPIPPERLEALPDATLCAACQRGEEQGIAPPGEVEYCPKCGAVMVVRLSRGAGVTRYVMACSECR